MATMAACRSRGSVPRTISYRRRLRSWMSRLKDSADSSALIRLISEASPSAAASWAASFLWKEEENNEEILVVPHALIENNDILVYDSCQICLEASLPSFRSKRLGIHA